MHAEDAREDPRHVLPLDTVTAESGVEEATEALDETSRDALQRYFREVGSHRLLSHEEEIDLSRKVRAGLEVRRRREAGEEIENLQQTLELARGAREKLIRHNLRLVVSIAKKYRSSGLPLIDLIQEGNIGLMTAVERYDPELGYRFSTYATFWIRQAIGRAVANLSRTIRVPVHMHDLISKVRRTESQLAQQYGRPATDADIARTMGIDVHQVEQVRRGMPSTTSLEAPVGTDTELTLATLVPHPDSEQAVDDVLTGVIHEQIRRSLETLTERERTVLMLRFGLNGPQPQTLAEIAKRLGVSRERVRQIEQDALGRLRRSDLRGLANGLA